MRNIVANMSGSDNESRLLAEEPSEFVECQMPKAGKDSHEGIPVAVAKTVHASIEGQFSNLAKSLEEGFVNLGKILTDGLKTSRQNLTSSSASSGSESDPEDKQPAPKGFKKQELSDDDVTKVVNELISSTLNKPTTDSPSTNSSQSTVLAMVADEVNEKQCGPGVAENLAKVVDKVLRTRLAEEKLKQKQNLYNRPKNGEAVVPTRVNSATPYSFTCKKSRIFY